MDEHTVVIRELGDRYQVSSVNPYLLGAGTVFDLAGSAVKKGRLGSLDQDGKSLAKDFGTIGEDWKRVFQRQYDTLTK